MNACTRIAPLLVCLALSACGGDDDAPPPQDSGMNDAAISDGGNTCMNQTLVVTNSGVSSWIIDGVSPDPTLTLCRGFTYTFQVSASGHPFAIHESAGVTSTSNRYAPGAGLTGQGVENGNLVFTPDGSAPATLHYQCEAHAAMTGVLTIVDP